MSDQDDNNIDDIFGDPYDACSIEEVLYIKDGQPNSPGALFYKKYKPILRDHERAFKYLTVFTTELACNFTPEFIRPRVQNIQDSENKKG